MKQVYFKFAACHRIIKGSSKHHKICLEDFLFNAKASNVPCGQCQYPTSLYHPFLSTEVSLLEIYMYSWKVFQTNLLNTSTLAWQNHCKMFVEICDNRFLGAQFLTILKWWYYKNEQINRIWNIYPSPMSKYILLKFCTWDGGLTIPLGLILSKAGRNNTWLLFTSIFWIAI